MDRESGRVFVGHAFVAFALAASAAASLGVARQRALVIGLAAGGFAVVPDVDILHAFVGLAQADPSGVWTAAAAFWDSSREVHRAVTHSLVVAGPAALGFGLAAGPRGRALALPVLGTIVTLGLVVDGLLAATMLAAFAATGVAVALGARSAGLSQPAVAAAAGIGLLSHPFGDLFTGTPPPLFYPFGLSGFGDRVVLHGDPTLNLLAIFGLELAAIWLGVVVAARLTDWPLAATVDWRAGLGAGYGFVALVLPPPTLETSYHFVFSVLAVGSVGALPMARPGDRRRAIRAGVSALAAVTLAGAAYTVGYLVA